MFTIYYYRIFETAREIDLSKLENALPSQHRSSRLRLTRIDPKSLHMEVPPLVLNLGQHHVRHHDMDLMMQCQARVYDIGAISICLQYANLDQAYLIEDVAFAFGAQRGLEELFAQQLETVRILLQPVVTNLQIDTSFFEDHTVYHVPRPDQLGDIVALLLGENLPFSPSMRDQVMVNRLSYTEEDFVIVTWDAALVCDAQDPADIRDLIEFANVQLLELRFYDALLTRQMDKMYDDIQNAESLSSFKRSRQYRRIMQTLMESVADVSEVAEKINNLIKITEDIYYAKVYQMTLKVLRTDQWTDSVNRKLAVIHQNYSMLSNEVNVEHSYFLEWIIIILIALEFAFSIINTMW